MSEPIPCVPRDHTSEATTSASMPLLTVNQLQASMPASLTALPAASREDVAATASVWLTGQDSDAAQRAGRYLPATLRHAGRTLPSIAVQAIAAYSGPGHTVLDPFCGTGTSLVEAVYAGRDAIGLEYHPRWADLAQANLLHAMAEGAPGCGFVVHGDARDMLRLLPRRLRGEVDLVVTTPPMRVQPTSRRLRIFEITRQLQNDLFDVLLASTALLHPGGHVVIASRPTRRAGHLIDLNAAIAAATDQTGLRLLERAVALREPIHHGQLRPRRRHVTTAHADEPPALPVVHEDVLVYRLPVTASNRDISR